MPVSFNYIPSNIRVPLFYAEISNALAGYQQINQPACLIGPQLATGKATANQPILVPDAGYAAAMFGAGSALADMVDVYRQNDTYGELWCIPLRPGGTPASATGSVAVAGTATGAGTLALYIGGDLFQVAVASGATAATVATAIAAAITADPNALVNAVAASATVNLTAKQDGTSGNLITISTAYKGMAAQEVNPPGLTFTLTQMSGGSGVLDVTPAFNAMGDDVYDFIGLSAADTAVLDAAGQAMNDLTGRWAWDRQIYGHCFAAKVDTAANLLTFGRTRNDQHISLMGVAPSASVDWRHAAALTAQAAIGLRNDPARPLQTLPLIGVLAPQRGNRFSLSTVNTLLYAGVAQEKEVSGVVQISRCVTTYQKNAWGQPDPSYLDVTTLATLQYFVRFLRARILQKFPRHKLADDGTSFGPGQAIVTPRVIKAEIIAAYSEMVWTGIVENIESFKELLIVERDPNDPNRVNVEASPDLVNQLRILAVLVSFRLQTAPVPAALAA